MELNLEDTLVITLSRYHNDPYQLVVTDNFVCYHYKMKTL